MIVSVRSIIPTHLFQERSLSMRSSRNVLAVLVLLVTAFSLGAFVFAADEKKAESSSPGADATKAASSDAADPKMMEKMMEAWMKLGTPGPQHEKLKMMVGKFDADVTMQMMPGMPEEKSKGTSDNKSIFDGRYVGSEYVGDFKGMPFKGHGLWAYDNQEKKFVSLWIDSMSTMVMIAKGDADASGKVITVESKCICPVTNKPMVVRQVLTIEDADHHTYESYATLEGEKEHKNMTIKYTKAK
jgi:hypothetical protein